MPSDSGERPDELLVGSQADAITNAVMRLHRDYLGRGPSQARTSIRHDLVVVLMSDTLTKAERTLVADGKEADVLRVRQILQRAMRSDLIEVVERLSGRKVVAFLSDNHIDPDLACEVFVLEPEQDK